jgi:hypothetical protein
MPKRKAFSGYGHGGYGRYGGYERFGTRDMHETRVNRAFEQPLQLMRCRYYPKILMWQLRVSSSSGHGYYTLHFTPDSGSCECPDFERRQKPCKHMLCVLLRILKLRDKQYTTVTQVGKSFPHITERFLALFGPRIPSPNVNPTNSSSSSSKPVGTATTIDSQSEGKAEEAKSEGKREVKETNDDVLNEETEILEEETCIICLLDFYPDKEQETIMQCTSHCQRWLGHRNCLNHWFQKSSLCPLCKGKQQPQSSSSSSQTSSIRS